MYENTPSELELGEVVFEVTVEVSPYFSEVEPYVVGLKVRVALSMVKDPLVTFTDGAVYESELVKDTVGTIE